MSIVRRPWEVWRITFGSTPSSLPILVVLDEFHGENDEGRGEEKSYRYMRISWRDHDTYPCQCLTTASVESMIVPSISKRIPAKVASSAGALYAPMLIEPMSIHELAKR